MKPRQVILEAFNGEKPSRVPVALIGGGVWSAFHYGTTLEDLSTDATTMSDMLVEMSDKLESDIVYAGSGYPNVLAAALGGKIKFSEDGAVDLEAPVISSEEEMQELDISMINKNAIINTVKNALKMTKSRIGEEYVVTMTAWGPFTLGARLVGEETLIKATIKKPDFVEKVLDFATKVLIRYYEPVVADGLLEVILLGDPTASGDLISKPHFEKYALPYLKKFTDWARSKGIHTLLHICGDTTDRLDLFPLTGASCISLDQKTDMAKAKEVLLGKMCFAGNIDPVKILLQGSVQDVEDACKRVIETVGTDGGFVLVPGCDIPPTVPYENIQKFVQVARDWKL
jgi:uroporphyrinogen decarboxylase